ncbi:MAG: cbb3-type cytochrome oxidase subunit 3 [Burkholderiaceae bacterium]
MDLDLVRYAVTVLSFAVFAGIVAWALSPRNRAAFDEAQQLPFLDSGDPR